MESRFKALKLFKENKSRENFLNYKKEVARTRIGLKKIKKENFRSFCENLRKNSDPSYVWRKIKAFKNSFSYAEIFNKYNKDTINAVYKQIEDLFPPGNSFPSPKFSTYNPTFEATLDVPFSFEELEMALRYVKIKASPGLDNIDYKIIKALPTAAKELLLVIYHRIFISQIFPIEWKRYMVFFILKQSVNLKFRPISLASCVCKTLERMISNRLTWFIEHFNLLSNSQFGFRRGRECIDNLAILYSNIHLGFLNNMPSLASFLDIKSAYDNVIPSILYQKLIDLGISQNIIAFIRNSIGERIVYCKFEEIDIIRHAFKGLPQGSVLSPILYNIYVSDLDKYCAQDCNIIQYADDIALFVSSYNTQQGKIALENSIKNIADHLNYLGLNLAPEKTKFCIFTKRINNSYSNIYLDLNGIEIYPSSKIKFLGLYFTPNLNWNFQITHIWKNCQCPLKILSCLRHTWWGADPRLLKILYIALIRSRIDYGCFIFHNLIKAQYLKLERIQLKALKLILGLRLSSPSNFVQMEVKEPNIRLRKEFLAKVG